MKPPLLHLPKVLTSPMRKTPPLPLYLPPDLLENITRVRQRRRWIGIIAALSALGSALCLLWLVEGLLDWEAALPWLVRALLLTGDMALLAFLYRRYFPQAFRRTSGFGSVAFAAEKRWPHFGQSLISAVEFCEGKSGSTQGSYQLALQAIDVAWQRTQFVNLSELVPWRTLRFWLIFGVLIFAATMGTVVHFWPNSSLLLQRILLSTASQTVVTPITRDMTAPIGSDVVLQAKAGGRLPSRGRVIIEYAGEALQEFPVTPDPDQPDLFAVTIPNVQKPFHYTFYLNDGKTPHFTVDAQTPPALGTLACHVIYPPYTGLPEEDLATGNLSILAGSRLQLTAVSTQNLRGATIRLVGQTPPQTIEMTVDATGKNLFGEIPIPASNLTGFSIHLINANGFPSSDETIYSIFPVPDRPPLVEIVEPRPDRVTIVATAKPTIEVDAKDDYGIARLSLVVQLVPPGFHSNVGRSVPEHEIALPLEPGKTAHVEYPLDLSTLLPVLTPGWTVDYWIVATDNNDVTGPGLTHSRPKHFEIVSLDDKEKEITERLQQAANSLDSVAGEQDKVTTRVEDALHH